MGNIHNSKALLEHHLELQNPRFKVSPPGQSKLQTLKYSAFCFKPRAHAWSYWIIWDTQAKRCKRALCEAGSWPEACNFQIKERVLPPPAMCLSKCPRLPFPVTKNACSCVLQPTDFIIKKILRLKTPVEVISCDIWLPCIEHSSSRCRWIQLVQSCCSEWFLICVLNYG